VIEIDLGSIVIRWSGAVSVPSTRTVAPSSIAAGARET
jgi:hypothetical protein